ncbi:hypothetical protein XPU_0315 [Xanthomonas arboricola pv. pruni str. MAFF 311562]|uniref:Flavodoxin-like domain-containing protein n=1 Tax=Xanthomonas arboricola pv. pruni str. MAFF 311562 TaxID=1414836 RepID=W4RY18_9XANT|nr:hypothetical protein XPU_0315 [Xanthomonas arboricola pv. pruni str. MAFF 311562]
MVINLTRHVWSQSGPPRPTGLRMSKIAIIYFSGYGHTVKLAEAVHAGAASVGEATLYRIDQDGNLPDDAWEAIGAADAIIYGSPTYMAGRRGSSRSLPTPAPSRGLRRPGRTRSPPASPTRPR